MNRTQLKAETWSPYVFWSTEFARVVTFPIGCPVVAIPDVGGYWFISGRMPILKSLSNLMAQ